MDMYHLPWKSGNGLLVVAGQIWEDALEETQFAYVKGQGYTQRVSLPCENLYDTITVNIKTPIAPVPRPFWGPQSTSKY